MACKSADIDLQLRGVLTSRGDPFAWTRARGDAHTTMLSRFAARVMPV